MTAIADLVTFLLSAEIPPESVSAVVELAQRHAIEQVEIHRNSVEFRGNSVETTDDRRRARDRERKRKSAESKKPPLILTSLASLTSEDKKEESKKVSKKVRRAREKKQLGPLPENWHPPDIAYPLATEFGTSVSNVEPVFRDYLKSSGKLYADHDAAFCNFVRNQRKFNGQTNGQSNAKPDTGIIQAADDLRRKIASFDGPPQRDIGIRDREGEAPPRLLSHR
jgi:hypothetical protein